MCMDHIEIQKTLLLLISILKGTYESHSAMKETRILYTILSIFLNAATYLCMHGMNQGKHKHCAEYKASNFWSDEQAEFCILAMKK